jgi:hypothetical protein
MALLPSQHRGGNLGKAIPRHDAGYYDVDKSPLGSVQELSQHLDACSWAFSVCNSSTPMPRNCSSTNTAQGAHLNLPNLHPTSSSKELEELRPQMLRTLLCSRLSVLEGLKTDPPGAIGIARALYRLVHDTAHIPILPGCNYLHTIFVSPNIPRQVNKFAHDMLFMRSDPSQFRKAT